jgi:hypothetical protein
MDAMTKRILELALVTIISWALTRYLVRPAVRKALASR